MATTEPVVLAATSRWRSFYELTKPRLNFLVLVTTFVGYYVAARDVGQTLWDWTLVHALIGTALTAASAAVLNQVVEGDFDLLMRRTRNALFESSPGGRGADVSNATRV